jgi:flagellar assembly factor FliW
VSGAPDEPRGAEERDGADLRFVEPLPGLGGHTRFRLTPIPGAPGLHALRAVTDDGDGPRLFVADAPALRLGYEPDLPAFACELLGGGDASSLRVLVVLHPADEDGPLTANLFAPIVVAPATGAALQVLLEGSPWPLRLPLIDEGGAS